MKISKEHPKYKAVKFVTEAIEPKDHRWYMTVVHAEDGKLVGTDGHRLHIADLEDVKFKLAEDQYGMIPNGNYKVAVDKTGIELTLDEGSDYPKWQRVVEQDGRHKYNETEIRWTAPEKDTAGRLTELAFEVMSGGTMMELEYLKPLLKLEPLKMIASAPEHLHAVIFENCSLKAVIMPIKPYGVCIKKGGR